MEVDDHWPGEEKTGSDTDLSRRDFVGRSGKALYIAPALTLLGSARAMAQFGSPPPPPGGAPVPPAPDQ